MEIGQLRDQLPKLRNLWMRAALKYAIDTYLENHPDADHDSMTPLHIAFGYSKLCGKDRRIFNELVKGFIAEEQIDITPEELKQQLNNIVIPWKRRHEHTDTLAAAAEDCLNGLLANAEEIIRKKEYPLLDTFLLAALNGNYVIDADFPISEDPYLSDILDSVEGDEADPGEVVMENLIEVMDLEPPAEEDTEKPVKTKNGEDGYEEDRDEEYEEEEWLEDTFGPEQPWEDDVGPSEEWEMEWEERRVRMKTREFSSAADWFKKLYTELTKNIFGQDNVIDGFVRAMYDAHMFPKERKGPKALFLFAGPPGVGKTYLAEQAAQHLSRKYRRFNMSGYADDKSYIDLVGVSKSFRNPHEGRLVGYVRKHPHAILIFDEIEKAHPVVLRLFLQILDNGTLMNDFREEETDFSNTIIIFTTNAGKSAYEAESGRMLSHIPKRTFLTALQTERSIVGPRAPLFPPEICSRLSTGNVFLFNRLSTAQIMRIIRKEFEDVTAMLQEKYAIELKLSEELPRLFLYHLGGTADARATAANARRFLLDEVYELSKQMTDQGGINKENRRFSMSVDLKGTSTEIRRLFKTREPLRILLLCKKSMHERLKKIRTGNEVYVWAEKSERALTLFDDGIDMVVIDPACGLKRKKEAVISLDDTDSEGMSFFRILSERRVQVPVYVIEAGEHLREVDKNTLLQRGATGTLFLGKGREADADASERMNVLLNDVMIEKRCEQLFRRGYQVNFETAQRIRKDGGLEIVFYHLMRKQSIDAEDTGFIMSDAERPDVKLDDVIGAENVKNEIRYYATYFKNPNRFLLQGGRVPKGLLLYGPPGTGKTMLARAMACACDASFIQCNATDLLAGVTGEGERRIRELFVRARRYAPTVIFIDEVDAIAKKRTGLKSGETLLNQLLVEMDGFRGNGRHAVFVLAATNFGVEQGDEGRLTGLDEAFLRRFDNKLNVDLPDLDERKQYLDRLCRDKRFKAVTEKARESMAHRTVGQSLAVLQNVMELAFRNAVRKGTKVLGKDVYQAWDEYRFGESRESTPDYYRKVAVHEAGHTYIAAHFDSCPAYVTIISRGKFGGYTQKADDETIRGYTAGQLRNEICILLAGRCAERLLINTESGINTGAGADLKTASAIALQMVEQYGMHDGWLLARTGSDRKTEAIDTEEVANAILLEEEERCMSLLDEGRDTVQALADRLLEKNHMTTETIREIMGEG